MKRRIYMQLALLMCLLIGVCGCKSEETGSVSGNTALMAVAEPAEGISGEAVVENMENSAIEETVREAVKGKIKIATVGSPHKEMLRFAAPLLLEHGYELEIVVAEDYFLANEWLASGQVDGNFYQHLAYLERYNQEYETSLLSLGAIYYEPMGIYSDKLVSLQDIDEGARIGVPVDPTGYARALLLLQEAGLLKLMEDADLTSIWEDVVENPHKVELVMMEQEELAASLDRVDAAVFSAGYGIGKGLSPDECLAVENGDSLSAINLCQILAAGKEEPSEGLTLLLEILRSKEMESFVKEEYQGSIILLKEE